MGKSEFDPAGNRPVWNAGRKVGAKRALKPRQVWALRFFLDQNRPPYRDSMPRKAKPKPPPDPFRWFDSSPEIIRLV